MNLVPPQRINDTAIPINVERLCVSIFQWNELLSVSLPNNCYRLRARRRWRAAVTGDPEKRIRDHMKETPQVKLMDKVSLSLETMKQ